MLAGLSDDQRAFLMDERRPFSFELCKFECELDEASRAGRLFKLWQQHGPGALARFIEANPGRRPRTWWVYSAPEATRRTVTGRCKLWQASNPWRGIPSNLHVIAAPLSFESSAAYLSRHGLLSAAELARLKPADWTPFTWHTGDSDDFRE